MGQEIRGRLRAGRSIRQVAQELGISTNTVAYHRDRVPPPEFAPADLRHTRSQVGTRETVERLLGDGLSQAEIARRLQLTKSTVSYHVRRLGKPRDERGARRYDWGAVQAYYDCGFTKRECQLAFGFSSESWHAAMRRGDLVTRSGRIPDDELFVEGVPRNRSHLKARLLESGLRTGVCSSCGLADWLGAPLSLCLHHRNGDRDDNRLENLELLCPNCHSQTENFAGRNRPARA